MGAEGAKPEIEKKRRDGRALAIVGALVMLAFSGLLSVSSKNAMGDFKVVYYSARTLLQHGNPYSEQDVLRVYRAEGRESIGEIADNRAVMTRFIYFPSTLVVSVPIAALGYAAGHLLWGVLVAVSMLLGAWAVWDLSRDAAPLLAGALLGLLLSGSFWVLLLGNSAAIGVGLCVFSMWCFLRERYAVAGVVCMTISLMLKPHDAGPVWLFLLSASPGLRRRAWQVLASSAAIGLPCLLYVQVNFPHWSESVRNNLEFFSRTGGIADAGPMGYVGRVMDPMVQLQVAVRLFIANARVADLVVYSVCGVLLVVWIAALRRTRNSVDAQYIALAAIIPLALLPLYHFQHDAKLLMLTIPACAVLARDKFLAKSAIALTTLTIALNTDILTFVQVGLLHSHATSGGGMNVASLLLSRAGTLALLLLTLFLLAATFLYVRREGSLGAEAATTR
ncbi:MAG: hypothetical protein KGN79_14790 [Acidobacteriota bacterium]|nr:hypothetical protein [Acidobacteriota bacterium]